MGLLSTSSSIMTTLTLFEEHLGHIKSLLRSYDFLFGINQGFGRLLFVSISIHDSFTIHFEWFSIVKLGHQKHTPDSLPRTTSLTPRRCRTPIDRIYSNRLFFRWLRTDAVVTASLTGSIASIVIIAP